MTKLGINGLFATLHSKEGAPLSRAELERIITSTKHLDPQDIQAALKCYDEEPDTFLACLALKIAKLYPPYKRFTPPS